MRQSLPWPNFQTGWEDRHYLGSVVPGEHVISSCVILALVFSVDSGEIRLQTGRPIKFSFKIQKQYLSVQSLICPTGGKANIFDICCLSSGQWEICQNPLFQTNNHICDFENCLPMWGQLVDGCSQAFLASYHHSLWINLNWTSISTFPCTLLISWQKNQWELITNYIQVILAKSLRRDNL